MNPYRPTVVCVPFDRYRQLPLVFRRNIRIELFGYPHDHRLFDADCGPDNQGMLVSHVKRNGGGIRAIFCPPLLACNRSIVFSSDFNEPTIIEGIGLNRKIGPGPNWDSADGVILGPGQAAAMLTGDCFIVTITDGKRVIVAHAGLQSLIGDFSKGVLLEDESSIVYKAVSFFLTGEKRRSPSEVFVHVSLGITKMPRDPEHLEYGPSNRRLLDALYSRHGLYVLDDNGISLTAIIQRQLESCGVPVDQITLDPFDTYSDKEGKGYRWHSHARASHEFGKGDPRVFRRNLVFVRYDDIP